MNVEGGASKSEILGRFSKKAAFTTTKNFSMKSFRGEFVRIKRRGNKTTGVHMGVHISKNGLFREKKPVLLQQPKRKS